MTNNNQDILEDVRVENGRQPEQFERLLGNRCQTAPTLPALLPASQICGKKLEKRRKSDNSLFGSFSRLKNSIGYGSKDVTNQINRISRFRQSRFNARRLRKRVVFKHGDCNVVQGHVAKRRRKYLQDIFTTLVDAQWRWTLLVFAMNFLLSWLMFATVWWLIVFTHGDLIDEHLNETMSWTPCVTNIRSFTSAFLYSIETQHTIGYGGRVITEECPEAIFVMCIQSITGVMIQAFMIKVPGPMEGPQLGHSGMPSDKIIPTYSFDGTYTTVKRANLVYGWLLDKQWDRNAVINHRDGVPCLMFRVGDMRKSHIIEAHVRAQLIKHKVTKEGEHLPFFQTELKVRDKVGGDGEEDRIFFIWPTTIVHKIDSKSPLYNMSANNLLRERFEIVVILEGVIESTGMTTQARSSYLPSEILWGHRFQSIVAFKKDSGEYEVDYAQFNNTVEVDTPLCSARELDERRAMYSNDALGQCRMGGIFPSNRTHSSDTLCSMDSLSIDDGHIEMKISSPIPVTVTAPEETKPLTNGTLKNKSNILPV